MKVKMKAKISGPRDGEDWPEPGEEIEVPDDEGAGLVRDGLAEPVSTHKDAETATSKKTAEKRTAKSKSK